MWAGHVTVQTSERDTCASTCLPCGCISEMLILPCSSSACLKGLRPVVLICFSCGLGSASMSERPGPDELQTAHGTIRLPAYIPVTTFGTKYPLDELVRPYLPRLAPAVMVSYHYAKQMTEHPGLPLLIDSGGFASLFEKSTVQQVGALGVLEIATEVRSEKLHPREVLEFQERHADVAFTLDFPIPLSIDRKEAKRRNAL